MKSEKITEQYVPCSINGRMVNVPLDEYLDIIACQSGFDGYDDCIKHGYHIDIHPEDIVESEEDGLDNI